MRKFLFTAKNNVIFRAVIQFYDHIFINGAKMIDAQGINEKKKILSPPLIFLPPLLLWGQTMVEFYTQPGESSLQTFPWLPNSLCLAKNE